MATSTVQSVTSAGRTASRAVGDALEEIGGAASKSAARGREEVEDIWADARRVADGRSIPAENQDKAAYAGLAATAGLGLLEWPLALAVGAGYAVVRSRNGNRRGSRRSSGGRSKS